MINTTERFILRRARAGLDLTALLPRSECRRQAGWVNQIGQTDLRVAAGGISYTQEAVFDRQRTDTNMTIAADRLAVIAAITLVIPLVRHDMNVMVNDSRKCVPLIILLLIMLAISLTRLRWGSQTGLVVISRLRGGVRKDDRSGYGGLRPIDDQVCAASGPARYFSS
jgi:hypothetical protein